MPRLAAFVRPLLPLACLALATCEIGPMVDDGSTAGSTGGAADDVGTSGGTAPATSGPISTGTTAADGSTGTGPKDDVGGSTGGPMGCVAGDPGCNPKIDVLIVLDNSGTMAEEQIAFVRAVPLLFAQLETLTDAGGTPVDPDVQLMVTTTDFGNPLCTPFKPEGYSPARGAPVDTSCTTRLADFTDLVGTTSAPEACQNLCPVAVTPDGDPFVAFGPDGDNIPDTVMPTDIDGDGVPESPAAQAAACLVPQGINGCGYESPLENMLQALNPQAEWNEGPIPGTNPRPFLRDGALLAIVLVTDEADCSVQNYSIMEDPAFHNINPDTGMSAPSSAICWNAGVACTGPDAQGVFSECHATDTTDLQPITRYTNYLIDELRDTQGKEVVMLGVLGVPPVTAHDPDPPFQPTAGGVFDLVYRNWVDGQYPAGDILPDEFAMGETAADKQFDFGIGPGCTGQDAMGGFTGQAIPPVRVKEVCESLDLDATPAGTRCCIESICDDDYAPALACLTGIIQESIQLPG